MSTRIARSCVRPVRQHRKTYGLGYNRKNASFVGKDKSRKIHRPNFIHNNKIVTDSQTTYDFLGPINKLTVSDAIARGLGDGMLLIGGSFIVAALLAKILS